MKELPRTSAMNDAMLAMLLTSPGHVWNIRVGRAAGKNAKSAERHQHALGRTSVRNAMRIMF